MVNSVQIFERVSTGQLFALTGGVLFKDLETFYTDLAGTYGINYGKLESDVVSFWGDMTPRFIIECGWTPASRRIDPSTCKGWGANCTEEDARNMGLELIASYPAADRTNDERIPSTAVLIWPEDMGAAGMAAFSLTECSECGERHTLGHDCPRCDLRVEVVA